MNKLAIGIIFIFAGLAYGSLAADRVYNHTLGWLAKNGWVKIPKASGKEKSLLGPKSSIFAYSLILIIIGLFIIWNRNI